MNRSWWGIFIFGISPIVCPCFVVILGANGWVRSLEKVRFNFRDLKFWKPRTLFSETENFSCFFALMQSPF